jgi:hypothetical protein
VSDPLSPLVTALRGAVPPRQDDTRLATVTGLSAAGVLVQFDGEASASTRAYMVAGDTVRVGHRVLMLRAGSTWVVSQVVSPLGRSIGQRGLLNAAQAIATGAWTTLVNWTVNDYMGHPGAGISGPVSGVWTLDSNGAGLWHMEFSAMFANTVGPLRAGRVLINGGAQVAHYAHNASTAWEAGPHVSWDAWCAAGSTIAFQVYQDSGAGLNVNSNTGGEYRTWFTLRRDAW